VLVIAVSDLMFQSRIRAAAAAVGADWQIADDAPAVMAALEAADAVIIDLHDRAFEAMEALAAARAAGARVLAFGRHTEPALLRSAREAGAEIVVPRSQLVQELPLLIERLTRVETN
jgi:DNA-binding NarL/FixJ family response regulator